KAEILPEFPEMGRIVPELNSEQIREIFVYSYRLVYKVYENKILIVAVIHGRRLLENHRQLDT
ncbi:type II toxin-antitoxin system RelE/ParE family toxin, partial [Nitratifractor sp.]